MCFLLGRGLVRFLVSLAIFVFSFSGGLAFRDFQILLPSLLFLIERRRRCGRRFVVLDH